MPEELPQIETRNTGETRADGPRLKGYAAVFDRESEPLPWVEVIKRGAFTRSLKDGDDVRALREHRPDLLLARSASGTLRLREDAHGLATEIDPPDTELGRDTLEMVRRRDLSQMSIAFVAVADTWGMKDGVAFREILEAKLFDVSLVAYPAYPDTTVATRRFELFRKDPRAMVSFRRRWLDLHRGDILARGG